MIRKKPVEEGRLPTRPIWTFLNSAFGLWLMTTVVVGTVVKVSTDHQECKKTAESSFRTYSKLNSELLHRAARVADALFNSVSISQANTVLARKGEVRLALYSDYKEWTLDDLLFAWRFEGARIGRNNPKLFTFINNRDSPQLSSRIEDLFVAEGTFHSDEDLDVARSLLEKVFDKERHHFYGEGKSFDASASDIMEYQCGFRQLIRW